MWRRLSTPVLHKITILISILSVLLMVFSAVLSYNGWMDYRNAQQLSAIDTITDPITRALKSFLFERGRMYVVLSTPDSISTQNRNFLNQRRKAADENFASAIILLRRSYPEAAREIEEAYQGIQAMRLIADREAQKTLPHRTLESRTLWQAKCTEFIDLVTSTLGAIGSQLPHNDRINQHNTLIIKTLHFRNVVGQESALFTSAIAASPSFSQKNYEPLLRLRGQSDEIWRDIQSLVNGIDSPQLTAAMKSVYNKYYNQFRPEQDRLLALGLNGQAYAGAATEIATLSVAALDSIFLLVDTAEQGVAAENARNTADGLFSLIRGIVQLAFSITIIAITPFYLKRRLIEPLNHVVALMDSVRCGKTDLQIDYVNRNDEIGRLAKGVEMLRQAMAEDRALRNQLGQAVETLQNLSVTDALTGLYNRRYIWEKLGELDELARSRKDVFSFIMCDLDQFKVINDTYGHGCGDQALVQAANLLRMNCREKDLLARWGGEEFLIVAADSNQAQAIAMAERIRKQMEKMSMTYQGQQVCISMTFGVSEYEQSVGIEGSIIRADTALLQGKKQGRNRVVAG